MLRVRPLLPVLKDVVEFSRASPDEIIILDFHRFPSGFSGTNGPAVHRELLELLKNELNSLTIPRPLSQTKLKLEEIWNSDKRIVVSYSEDNFVWGEIINFVMAQIQNVFPAPSRLVPTESPFDS